MTGGMILLMMAIGATCMNARAADQIKLGLMTQLSGAIAISGTEIKRGFDLAIEELGNKLGGTPVTVYVVDDKSTPSEAVQGASKLIDQYKVNMICGSTNPAWTPVFSKIAAVVTDQGGTLSHTAIVAREYGVWLARSVGHDSRHQTHSQSSPHPRRRCGG